MLRLDLLGEPTDRIEPPPETGVGDELGTVAGHVHPEWRLVPLPDYSVVSELRVMA